MCVCVWCARIICIITFIASRLWNAWCVRTGGPSPSRKSLLEVEQSGAQHYAPQEHAWPYEGCCSFLSPPTSCSNECTAEGELNSCHQSRHNCAACDGQTGYILGGVPVNNCGLNGAPAGGPRGFESPDDDDDDVLSVDPRNGLVVGDPDPECNADGYIRRRTGTCTADAWFIETAEMCGRAAASLNLPDTVPGGATNPNYPAGCYFKLSSLHLYFHTAAGDRADTDVNRVSLCRCTPPTQQPSPVPTTRQPTSQPSEPALVGIWSYPGCCSFQFPSISCAHECVGPGEINTCHESASNCYSCSESTGYIVGGVPEDNCGESGGPRPTPRQLTTTSTSTFTASTWSKPGCCSFQFPPIDCADECHVGGGSTHATTQKVNVPCATAQRAIF